jgi:hypothetical protein
VDPAAGLGPPARLPVLLRRPVREGLGLRVLLLEAAACRGLVARVLRAGDDDLRDCEQGRQRQIHVFISGMFPCPTWATAGVGAQRSAAGAQHAQRRHGSVQCKGGLCSPALLLDVKGAFPLL